MKSAKKIATVVASAFISACFFVGCGKAVNVSIGDIMQDIDVRPTQEAAYEEYSKQALKEFFDVAEADGNLLDGEINYDNAAVKAAAIPVAAKLFAYACYNERTLNQYVYFSEQEGDTDLGSNGSATAIKQEYFLRINEQEGVTCGYKYQYSIKYVDKCDGLISSFKSTFEQARTRIVVDTDQLYRLEGSTTSIYVKGRNEALGVDLLDCNWKTGSDWGITDNIELVKGSFIEPGNIKADIEDNAGKDNITIRANINILADNIVKDAIIIKDESEENGLEGYLIVMTIDTEVANKDSASLKMLRHANGSSNCTWVSEGDDSGLSIMFRIWSNGLFRSYSVSERWNGKIKGYSGTADSLTMYYYSYSDNDCDMTPYLKILEDAKAAKGN